MKSSSLIWRLLHTVKSTVKILSIIVAFSENVNFKYPIFYKIAKNFYIFQQNLDKERYFNWNFIKNLSDLFYTVAFSGTIFVKIHW